MRPVVRSEEHTGEWKVTFWADTPEEIFTEAASFWRERRVPFWVVIS